MNQLRRIELMLKQVLKNQRYIAQLAHAAATGNTASTTANYEKLKQETENLLGFLLEGDSQHG